MSCADGFGVDLAGEGEGGFADFGGGVGGDLGADVFEGGDVVGRRCWRRRRCGWRLTAMPWGPERLVPAAEGVEGAEGGAEERVGRSG